MGQWLLRSWFSVWILRLLRQILDLTLHANSSLFKMGKTKKNEILNARRKFLETNHQPTYLGPGSSLMFWFSFGCGYKMTKVRRLPMQISSISNCVVSSKRETLEEDFIYKNNSVWEVLIQLQQRPSDFSVKNYWDVHACNQNKNFFCDKLSGQIKLPTCTARQAIAVNFDNFS